MLSDILDGLLLGDGERFIDPFGIKPSPVERPEVEGKIVDMRRRVRHRVEVSRAEGADGPFTPSRYKVVGVNRVDECRGLVQPCIERREIAQAVAVLPSGARFVRQLPGHNDRVICIVPSVDRVLPRYDSPNERAIECVRRSIGVKACGEVHEGTIAAAGIVRICADRSVRPDVVLGHPPGPLPIVVHIDHRVHVPFAHFVEEEIKSDEERIVDLPGSLLDGRPYGVFQI